MALQKQTIAKELGVSAGRVSQMKGEGMPCHSIDAAKAWVESNVKRKATVPSPSASPAPRPGDVSSIPPTAEPTTFDLNRARAKRETHEANMAEMRERERAGELVEAKRVEKAMTDLAAQMRLAVERIPDKVPGLSEAQRADLQRELDQALDDLAESSSRLSDALAPVETVA